MDQVKAILSELEVLYEEFEHTRIDLVEVSKREEPQRIAQLRYQTDQLEDDIVRLRNDLLELDCVIKDYKSGLVDFVALRKGKPVWLCYKRGEGKLEYYHGWEDGFVGRQLIDFE